MKIALSTFNDNLSSVFDFADTLQIFTVEDGTVKEKREYLLQNINRYEKIAEIKNLNLDALICGCMSRCSYEILTQSGMKIIPNLSGKVNEIIDAYLNNKISETKFYMPGFGNGKGGRSGRCRQKQGFGNRNGRRCDENEIKRRRSVVAD